jgi:hypothetical protein
LRIPSLLLPVLSTKDRTKQAVPRPTLLRHAAVHLLLLWHLLLGDTASIVSLAEPAHQATYLPHGSTDLMEIRHLEPSALSRSSLALCGLLHHWNTAASLTATHDARRVLISGNTAATPHRGTRATCRHIATHPRHKAHKSH